MVITRSSGSFVAYQAAAPTATKPLHPLKFPALGPDHDDGASSWLPLRADARPGGRSWEGRGLAYRVGTVGRQVCCAELAGAAGAGRTPGERIDEDVNVARLADRPHYRGQIAEIRRR